jgi:hypothetical protein
MNWVWALAVAFILADNLLEFIVIFSLCLSFGI